MRESRIVACIVCLLVTAFLATGCTTVPSNPTPDRELRTYAIIAADDQGDLSQTELNSVVDTLVQFLLDQGYVRSDQTFVDDPAQAMTIFRMKIAWNEGRTSFAVVSVAPSSGGAIVYAGEIPADVSPGRSPYDSPYDDWDNDPWRYDDDFGYAYGPYCPFLTIFPFMPFYGFEHHRRPTHPVARHPSEHHQNDAHRPRDWSQHRHYTGPWEVGRQPSGPLLPQQRPGSPFGHQNSSPVGRRNHRTSEHQTATPTSGSSRPPPRDSDARPAPGVAPDRPPVRNTRGGPPPGPPRISGPSSDREVRPPPNDAHRTSPSRPPGDNRTVPPTGPIERPQHRDTTNRAGPTPPQQPASASGRDHPAPAPGSMPPTRPAPNPDHRPPRDPPPERPAPPPTAPPRTFVPPPPRDNPPAQRNLNPPSSRESTPPSPRSAPPPPAPSSSNSKTDDRSSGRDKAR